MKKMRYPLLLALLALCLALGGAASAAAFPDTAGTGLDADLEALQSAGVIVGCPDGTFRPEAQLTQAETAALFSRAFLLARTGKSQAADLAEHWAYDAIMACLDNGFFDDADPAAPVTLLQFTKSLRIALGGEDGLAPTEDDAPLTRGEAAALLHQALAEPFGTKDATYYRLLAAKRLLDGSTVLRWFTLAGYYEDDTIHAVPLDAQPAAYVYEPEYRGFVETAATAEAVVYNFVGVFSADDGEDGDTLFIVRREDGNTYWDADAYYTDPRGSEDPAYRDTYNNAYNIPAGERLLGFGDGVEGAMLDYYNLAAPGDLSASAYYFTYDWYNSTSTETLTMLTGFRTVQQSNGWACGLSSALMAMDWFDMRDGLNELDLAALRNTKEKYGAYRWGSATDVKMFLRVFEALNDMEGKEVWKWESTYDFVDEDGELSEDYLSPDWIRDMLAQGRPVLVGWNSFGGHWQVIIGYDDMGTETTADDVLLLADPYDSTDHLNDGVNVQSYERLYYDWTQNFDRDFGRTAGYGMPVIFAPYPAGYDADAYKPIMGAGLVVVVPAQQGAANTSDDMLIDYGTTADDLAASDYTYAKEQAGENGLAGPASSDYYRQFQVSASGYYPALDFFGGTGLPESLVLLDGFYTSQQASEWTCGPSSLRMALYRLGLLDGESEFALAALRENDREGATTLDGMVQMLDALALDLTVLTSDDMDEDGCIDGRSLYDGASGDGMIPYYLQNGIPVIIGWDEWGGHWQVVIGYDDMGTEETQDDILILADPYDTTDHLQDGYVIESFERLVYGWGAAFDPRGGEVFVIAIPSAFLAK